MMTTLTCAQTIKEFCKNQASDSGKFNVFLELDTFKQQSGLIDVILKDKVSHGKLYKNIFQTQFIYFRNLGHCTLVLLHARW